TATPHYRASTLQLLPGDHLLLYTDGLIEHANELIDEGLDRLARTVPACVEAASFLDELLDALVDPQTRSDDICAIHISR
ncbi:SpoIIE family protein phosphatase, partial [Streptacidiphilus neutrinimicus]|uniref:SpoIIE family protein phosphatase n=1 Tax=Streptacidiphilus neutrinimicus TaxID=105420 RepID=UPI0005A5FAE8